MAEPPTPQFFSRHYYDLAMLLNTNEGKAAATDFVLLEHVSKHKFIFFQSGWASYDTAQPGTLQLMPAECGSRIYPPTIATWPHCCSTKSSPGSGSCRMSSTHRCPSMANAGAPESYRIKTKPRDGPLYPTGKSLEKVASDCSSEAIKRHCRVRRLDGVVQVCCDDGSVISGIALTLGG